MECGEQCVAEGGIEQMQMQCADSLDSLVQVKMSKYLYVGALRFFISIGATARFNGAFGRGNGPVFLADIACGGLEARLFDCTRGELEENDCSHSRDAGVICLAGKQN